MMEPFKIKSVEHIRITTKEERIEAIRKAEYNLFNIPSELVMIDLLTDRDIRSVEIMLEGLRKEIQDGIYD